MILNNRTTWNEASDAERTAVIQQLMNGPLKDSFEYLCMETYTCKHMTNTVGIFRHIATEMRFHLLPGDQEVAIGSGNYHGRIRSKYSIDLREYLDYKVDVSPFLISQYMITEKAWYKFDGAKLFRNFGDDHPIDAVERKDVEEWGSKAGLKLPSEVEWEYACRAGSSAIFYWGNLPNLDYAWTEENFKPEGEYITYTADQQKAPNAFGLLGMIGNLAEWVEDDAYHFGDQHTSQEACKNPMDSNADGILRGGWNHYGWNFNRCSSRIQCGGGDTGCSARMVFLL